MQLTNHMGIVSAPHRLAAAVALAASLAGCAGNSSLSPSGLPPGAQSLAPASHAHAMLPPPCVADVWATSGPANQVVGYNSAGTVCVTVTTANGLPFSQPQGVATDHQGYVYVADIFNNRVVVLDPSGAYWSTLSVPNLAPIGVCVSRTGLVGVVSNAGNTGIDFYTSKGAPNSVSPPSSTTAAVAGTYDRYCAFDWRGNFFTSGYNGTFVINYLRYNFVNVSNAAVQTCTTGICTGHKWFGMYVHTHNILSIEDYSRPAIMNMRVVLAPGNQLTFNTWATHPVTAITGFTSSCGQGGPIAATLGNGGASRVYAGECNGGGWATLFANNVWSGGTLNPFASNAGTGIATYPS